MFGWIVTGDTLYQLLHRCSMGRIIQEYAGDNLIYHKKTLAELTMKKQNDKKLLCLSQKFPRYTTTRVHQLTSIIVIGRILSRSKKMQTKSWDKRVTSSIFGMYCVDVWLMYHGCNTDTLHKEPDLNQQ